MALIDSIDWGTQAATNAGVINVYFATGGETWDSVTSDGWSAYEISKVMEAFAVFENYINVTFTQVFNPAQSHFQLLTTNDIPYGGYFNPPGTVNAGVGVFNTDNWGWDTTGGLEQGGYSFITLLHEIGHGLGLAHPHDDGGTSSIMNGVLASSDFGDYNLNQGVYTTMSYNDGYDSISNSSSTDKDYGWQGTIMALDIAVLQDKYGVNNSYNSGNNVYTLASLNAAGTFYTAIWDTGGIDTIVSSSATNSTIDLRAATLQYENGGGGFISATNGGIDGGFIIANGVVIENATGGSGNDRLISNNANNGLNGGAGFDIADFIGDTTDLVINLFAGTAISVGSGADTLISIEGIYSGDGNDLIYGNDYDNILFGRLGNDIITGANGDDNIDGGGGNDWLYGQDGNDTINAGDGAVDVSLGGNGNDTILGAGGFDYIYGEAGNDTLNGGGEVDVIYGGSGNDNISGAMDTDWLFGGDDNDIIDGFHGSDLLFGGAGVDTLKGGEGNDWIWGGSSNGLGDGAIDTFVFEINWGADVIYDFENGIDKIDLSGSGATSFADLSIGQIAGGFTWIAYGADVIYLWGAGNVNVGAGNIDASDFIFV